MKEYYVWIDYGRVNKDQEVIDVVGGARVRLYVGELCLNNMERRLRQH